MTHTLPSIVRPESLQTRLQRMIELHFDPIAGAPFWLDRARMLGINPLRDIYRVGDLALLGDMTPEDLRSRPLLDYIPRALHDRLDQLVLGQTGGTTGAGTWTAYRDDEFVDAFVLPFVSAAAHVRFPGRQQWLFIGPSGPHIIGKVVRQLAAALGSPDPFSVDFDPRWAKKLPEGSFARERYLAHVTEQAMDVIRTQEIGVLFTTPPVLRALAAVMTEPQRRRIRGIHYGGMSIEPDEMRQFQTVLFPEAVHLSGYGNTLLGCALELSGEPGRNLDYFPYGNRLVLEVVGDRGASVQAGETGRVRVTRLDETMLIIRMLERDIGSAVPPPPDAPAEFIHNGIRNPRTNIKTASKAAIGLY